MSYTNRFTETHYPLLIEHADSFAANTYTSDRVNFAKYHRGALIVDVGDMAAGATFDITLYQATASSGGTTKIITGKSITALAQANDDGNQVLAIELRTEELDVTGGFEYVYVVAVVGVDAVEYSWILYGTEPRYAPVATTNYTEIID